MKMRKSQNDDAPSIDSFVKNAPRFWIGVAALKAYVVGAANAFIEAVSERYTTDGAKKAGKYDGLYADGTVFPFQIDCQATYNKASLDAGSTVSEIVAVESARIQRNIAGDLPNMKQDLQRHVDKKWAVNHLKCATQLEKQEKEKRRFLFERGLPVDDSITIRGDYGWKFRLPLVVLVLLEFSINYYLLKGADLTEVLQIVLATVVLMLCSGFAVSWLWKASRSAVVLHNRLMSTVQKVLCWIGIAFSCAAFLFALYRLVDHRAGLVADGESTVERLVRAFENPLDFVLVLFNFLFFGVTIATFHKAGWSFLGYGKLHDQLQKAEEAYENSSNVVDNAARSVFDAAHQDVKQRRLDVGMMLKSWDTVREVFENIPAITREVSLAIETRYTNAIKSYRDEFAKWRIGIVKTEVQSTMPPDIQADAPIAPLSPIQPLQGLDLDRYREQAEAFEQMADDWAHENSDINELNRFLDKLKNQLLDEILKAKKEDLQRVATESEGGADAGQ